MTYTVYFCIITLSCSSVRTMRAAMHVGALLALPPPPPPERKSPSNSSLSMPGGALAGLHDEPGDTRGEFPPCDGWGDGSSKTGCGGVDALDTPCGETRTHTGFPLNAVVTTKVTPPVIIGHKRCRPLWKVHWHGGRGAPLSRAPQARARKREQGARL